MELGHAFGYVSGIISSFFVYKASKNVYYAIAVVWASTALYFFTM